MVFPAIILMRRRIPAACSTICRCGKRRRHYQTSRILGAGTAHADGGDANCEHSPATNGGTVVGVWIFHRHGDRAPNRYLGDPAHLHAESEHWYGRIPPPPDGGTDTAVYDDLSRFFPPEIHQSQNGGRYLDVSREPFGFLTYRGMDQMRNVGRRFRNRYERFGQRNSAASDARRQYSFLDHWDVKAFSTNYLRTVMSVQCFLDGLMRKGKDTDVIDSKKLQISAGGGLRRYYNDVGKLEQLAHLAFPTWTTAEDMMSDGRGGARIKVQVRSKGKDTLNSFDRNPEYMDGLVKDVIATEQFQRIDEAAKPLADTLTQYLPGLRNAPQAFGGTPSCINWVHAHDHFVCRKSHSVPLLAFSKYVTEKDAIVSAVEEMESLATPVCSHLAWRFREWYRCPRLLSSVACPPFKEMIEQMVKAAATEKKVLGEKQPFVLYSCHDVTLLALLYAIGAEYLVAEKNVSQQYHNQLSCGTMSEEAYNTSLSSINAEGYVSSGKSTQDATWRWWPSYSSTIAFELVRLDEGGEDRHVIRVILNGEAVKLIPRMTVEDEGMLKHQSLASRQVFGENHNMMSLSNFEQVISVLEEIGGGFPNDQEGLDGKSGFGVDGG